jgi:hypothetical protein
MKTKTIIIYGLIAAALIAGSYYGYKWYKKSKVVTPSTPPAKPSHTVATAQTGTVAPPNAAALS